MKRLVVILMALLAVVFVSTLGMMLAIGRSGGGGGTPGQTLQVTGAGSSQRHSPLSSPLTPDADTASLSIPEFALVDEDGRPITRADLLGKVTILDFFFTHCTFVCPLLTQTMSDQSRALKDTPVRLLSISVDPAHDTLEVIKAYAAEHRGGGGGGQGGVDAARWMFARGDRETVGKIVTGGLQFAVGESTKDRIKLPDGSTMANIVHPPWFVLVGPKAEVLGIYLATDDEEMRALTERARAAAKAVR